MKGKNRNEKDEGIKSMIKIKTLKVINGEKN